MTLTELRNQATVPVAGGYLTWPAPYTHTCVTLEDADFLYALVRVTKPRLVIESGTGLGIAARFIGEALRDNDRGGELISYESDDWIAAQARLFLDGLPVTVKAANGFEDVPRTPDMVFIDSHAGRRRQDITYWLNHAFTGLVIVHDAMREYDELDGDGVVLPGSDGLWIGNGA